MTEDEAMILLAGVTWRAAVVGRWAARILGTLMALGFLTFLVGEGLPPLLRMGWRENLYFLGLLAMFAGLLVTWKWERCGGLVTLTGFALLVLLGARWNGMMCLFPAVVALLHLMCGWRLAAGPPSAEAPWEVPRAALGAIGGIVAVFILLSANEIFGNPPLMTVGLTARSPVIGVWRGNWSDRPVTLIIGPDGAVSGNIGDIAFSGGRASPNRSWFGRLMNWRTDYIIRGERVQGWLVISREGLRGGIAALPGERRPVLVRLTRQ